MSPAPGASSPAAWALVTGASRGVGRATALALAARGLSVGLLGRPSVALTEATAAVAALGGRALAIACDVSDAADVDRARGQALEALGPPQVLVNNAGVVHRGTRVEDTDVASWDHVLGVNLRGPFLVARAFLPAMRAAGRGRLVHVASISATIGCPGAASYAASKWGLVGLAKSLAEELRGSGLASIALLPGSIDTEMLVGSGFAPAMTAEDVAQTIVHLALDAPDAMNGAAVEMFG